MEPLGPPLIRKRAFIETLKGKRFCLLVEPATLVRKVKEMSAAEVDIVWPSNSRLVHGGEELENDRRLFECGVRYEDTVYLLPDMEAILREQEAQKPANRLLSFWKAPFRVMKVPTKGSKGLLRHNGNELSPGLDKISAYCDLHRQAFARE